MDPRALGRAAEAEVARELARRGYVIVGKNVRLQRGELDLIARRDRRVWFVEVKCRARADVGPPHRAVDRRKRRALFAAAREYLHRQRDGSCFGFLVASVVWARPPEPPIITVARLPVTPPSS
ncbi:MAG: YraN family protein [Planctomycetes bacterium]|nr:YraN family protein [Planctomycetota bacterium]